jgi:hypothetical protein
MRMAEDKNVSNQSLLSERLAGLVAEAQRLVLQGAEHQRHEFKSEASIAKANKAKRAQFVKLVQALANAHLNDERFVIIGADQKNKTFVPVTNREEFDPAQVIQVISRYLTPTPSIEVFNSLTTDGGTPFVMVVIAGSQPRPILIQTQLQDDAGNLLLREGDCWIKETTSTRPASPKDFDTFYEEKIEAEAEARARRRFNHLIESQGIPNIASPATRIPDTDLLYAADEVFRNYVKQLIASTDARRFGMLIELLRDSLVQDWQDIAADLPGYPPHRDEFLAQVETYRKDRYLPAIRCLTECGLLLVKNSGEIEWLAKTVMLFATAVEEARKLTRIKAVHQIDADFTGINDIAFEAWAGVRFLTTYVVLRQKFEYLTSLIKVHIRPPSAENQFFRPLLFVFSYDIPLPDGQNIRVWEKTSDPLRKYFGSREAFLSAACELEFILEFNSWLAMGNAGTSGPAWIEKHQPKLSMAYHSDLWLYNLATVFPLAEKLLEEFARTPRGSLIHELSVEDSLVQTVLANEYKGAGRDMLGDYLYYLKTEQGKFMQARQRYGAMFYWSEQLKPLVDAARERQQIARAKQGGN